MKRVNIFKFFKSSVCGIGWILLIPFVLSFFLVVLLLLLWRLLVNYVVLKKHPDWKHVYGPDLFFSPGLYMDEQKSRWNLALSFFLENNLNLSIREIQDLFYKRVLTNPDVWKLKCIQRECLGFYYWVPVSVNLNKHITEVTLQPIPNETPETIINSFTEHLNSWILLDAKNKPHWEILISRYKATDKELCKTCFTFKMHHSIGTAASMRKIFELLDDCTESEVPRVQVQKIDLTEISRDLLYLPWTLIKTCWKGIKMKNIVQIQPFIESTDQVLGFGSTPVEQVKIISKAFGVPFRNVLAGVFGSAIRRYLLGTMGKSSIPEKIPILVNLPWKYSGACGDSFLNNHVTQSFVSYPLHHPDPVYRFTIYMKEIEDFFYDGMDKFTYLSSYFGYLLPNLALRPMTAFCRSSAILSTDIPIYTNKPIKLFGSTLTQAVGQVGLYGPVVGFMGIFFTMGDRIDFSIIGSTFAISTNEDALRIGQYFNEELNVLLNCIAKIQNPIPNHEAKEISLPIM